MEGQAKTYHSKFLLVSQKQALATPLSTPVSTNIQFPGKDHDGWSLPHQPSRGSTHLENWPEITSLLLYWHHRCPTSLRACLIGKHRSLRWKGLLSWPFSWNKLHFPFWFQDKMKMSQFLLYPSIQIISQFQLWSYEPNTWEDISIPIPAINQIHP